MRNFIRILLPVLFIAFFVSCEDDSRSTTCDVENPVEDLPWMKAKIESWEATSGIYEYQYIKQGTYQGQTVFLAGDCCPHCDTIWPVYNCLGEELEGIDVQDINNLKTIWKPADSQCTW